MNVFHFVISFLKTRQTKETIVSLSFFLVVASTFCINQAHTENKVGHQGEIKSQDPREHEYKKCCLNGGECFYLDDKGIIGCEYSWWYGRKRYEK